MPIKEIRDFKSAILNRAKDFKNTWNFNLLGFLGQKFPSPKGRANVLKMKCVKVSFWLSLDCGYKYVISAYEKPTEYVLLRKASRQLIRYEVLSVVTSVMCCATNTSGRFSSDRRADKKFVWRFIISNGYIRASAVANSVYHISETEKKLNFSCK